MWIRSRRISKRVLAPGNGYNNGWGLPSAGNSAYMLRKASGSGRRLLLGFRPQHSSYCSGRHSDTPNGFELGRRDFDMNTHLNFW
ncbi:hypothetical protein AVEN_41862-1 [Araneus ventricosus]|uniref:Uncharacterized protein n=1 Tax=Araneus ventricosus TaxID=182803 RepID=A0A4Y2AD03_ARAVE|nr:hypothetical protein AVEN_41862-1 [Araneus ventricosus]